MKRESKTQYPAITHSLDQATLVSADAWEQFFAACCKYAELARQRRAAALAAGQVPSEPEHTSRQNEDIAPPDTAHSAV